MRLGRILYHEEIMLIRYFLYCIDIKGLAIQVNTDYCFCILSDFSFYLSCVDLPCIRVTIYKHRRSAGMRNAPCGSYECICRYNNFISRSNTKREHGKAVPTWNYAVVHARGPLHFIEDAEWLRAQVDALTQQQESNLAEPWAVSDAPADYVEKMLAAIVGVEMTVISLEGKWKVSQNQPEGNRDGVVAGLCGLGRADAAALIRRD